MKTRLVALAVGFGIETTLIGALFLFGGFGPCGPTSPVGELVLIIHAPAFFITDALRLPETASLVLVVTSYAALWGGIVYLMSGPRRRQ